MPVSSLPFGSLLPLLSLHSAALKFIVEYGCPLQVLQTLLVRAEEALLLRVLFYLLSRR